MAQRGKAWTRLTLLDGQMIAMGDWAIHNVAETGKGAFTLSAKLSPDMTLDGESDGQAGAVSLCIPAEWEPLRQVMVNGQAVQVTKDSNGRYRLRLPAAQR